MKKNQREWNGRLETKAVKAQQRLVIYKFYDTSINAKRFSALGTAVGRTHTV